MAENKKIGKYDFIEYFDDANVYKVSVNNIYKLINADGEVLLEAEYISDPILICNKYLRLQRLYFFVIKLRNLKIRYFFDIIHI